MQDSLLEIPEIAMTLGVSSPYVYTLIKNKSPLLKGIKKIGRAYKIPRSRLYENLGMKWNNN